MFIYAVYWREKLRTNASVIFIIFCLVLGVACAPSSVDRGGHTRMLRGFLRNIRPLEILNGEQIDRVHAETLEVLERTGINFLHQKCL